ncbi:hypothetical protein WJX73_009767 [Symbiochloris irregularis]|uniref:F-box domain-containing protein n=1 Tax=Symbiochloris irregularis TaxID=706552 RepID=A0AAW1NQC5_9CHLO
MQQDKAVEEPFSWELPPELLAKVFKNLNLLDKLRAELCCRTWYRVLSRPQARNLWGSVTMDLIELPKRICCLPADEEKDRGLEVQSFLPTSRWLRARASAMSSLKLVTLACAACSSGNDWAERAKGGLTMLLGALSGKDLAVHISLECAAECDETPEWLLHPMLRTALARNLMFKQLEQLSGLRALLLTNLDDDNLNAFLGGKKAVQRALGELTMLTRLEMDNCEFWGFDTYKLRGLTRLRKFRLTQSGIEKFKVPKSWNLRELQLQENYLTQLPSKLTHLKALETLNMEGQWADFQITESMQWLTQLRRLKKVQLSKAASETGDCWWNEASLFALMEGQLLIEETPGCSVELCN